MDKKLKGREFKFRTKIISFSLRQIKPNRKQTLAIIHNSLSYPSLNANYFGNGVTMFIIDQIPGGNCKKTEYQTNCGFSIRRDFSRPDPNGLVISPETFLFQI